MMKVIDAFLADAVEFDAEARALEELVRRGAGRESSARRAREAADSMLEGAVQAERKQAALVSKLLEEGCEFEREAQGYEAKADADPTPEGAKFWRDMAVWKRGMADDKVNTLLSHVCN